MNINEFTAIQQEAIKAMQRFTGIEKYPAPKIGGFIGFIDMGSHIPTLEVRSSTFRSLLKRVIICFADGKYRLTQEGYNIKF